MNEVGIILTNKYIIITTLRFILPFIIIILIAQKKDKYTVIGDTFSKQLWNCYDVLLLLFFSNIFLYINALIALHYESIPLSILKVLLILYENISSFVLNIILFMIYFILTFSILYAIIKIKYNLSFSTLDFRRRNLGYYIIYGLRIFFMVLFIFSIFTYIFIDDYNTLLPNNFITAALSPQQVMIISFLSISISSIVEETIFRGFMYVPIKRKIGGRNSALLISLIEALTHFNYGLDGFIVVFIMGLISFYIYEKSGSLIPCILFHALRNSSVTIIGDIYPFLKQLNVIETQANYFLLIGTLSLWGFIILMLLSNLKVFRKA